MAVRWGAAERNTLKLLLAEGVELNLLKQHLPHRTHDALHREAQKYGYGVETVNGIRVLYYGKKTRNRKKKADDTPVSNDATKTAIGEKTATNSSTPTTSECLDNKSDVIVADSNKSSHGNTLKFIYDDINKLLSSTKYSHIESIMVKLENIAITVSKGST